MNRKIPCENGIVNVQQPHIRAMLPSALFVAGVCTIQLVMQAVLLAQKTRDKGYPLKQLC